MCFSPVIIMCVGTYTWQAEITAMSMHPHDETLFVTADFSGSIMFWNVNSGEPMAVRGSGEQGAHEA